jgi:hypothetical protein
MSPAHFVWFIATALTVASVPLDRSGCPDFILLYSGSHSRRFCSKVSSSSSFSSRFNLVNSSLLTSYGFSNSIILREDLSSRWVEVYEFSIVDKRKVPNPPIKISKLLSGKFVSLLAVRERAPKWQIAGFVITLLLQAGSTQVSSICWQR